MEIVAHFKHYSLAMDFYALGHPMTHHDTRRRVKDCCPSHCTECISTQLL